MKEILKFAAVQLFRMIALLFCVSVVAFALVSHSPVDPLQANVGSAALGSLSPEQIQKLEAHWGVHEPPLDRYKSWAKDFVQGDLGVSLLYRRSVAEIIAEKASTSFHLMLTAWLLSGVLGLLLGMIAGIYCGKAADRVIQSTCLLVAGTPAFWLAILLLLLFSVHLGLFPVALSAPIGMEAAMVGFADRVRHVFLPALTLSIVGIPPVALHTREKMIEIFQSDYVLFAKARGESGARIVWHHGLRGVLLPAVTLQCASLGELFGGSVLVEQVFSYPGLGQAAVTAGLGGDVPLLLGITLISAAFVFGGNLAANLLYGVVDPRMRGRVW